MNHGDILRALDECETSILESFPDEKPSRADVNGRDLSKLTKICHALWMIGEAREFARDDRLPKAFRWLGFVQGVMWSIGIVTIGEAKEANRPKTPVDGS